MWMILMTAPVHPENNWPQIWFHCYSHCQSLCAGLKRVFTLLSPSLHIFSYFLCFISLFEQSKPSSGSVLVQPANLLRTGLFSLQTHIIHFLWTSLILMDDIDSSCVAPRFACRHRRSNRTAASKDDLVLGSAQKKCISDGPESLWAVLSLWPAQIYILHVWCFVFFSPKPADSLCRRFIQTQQNQNYIRVDEGSQSTKVLYRRQLDLFLFTSHPRGFQFHIRSSLHWSNNHRVWSGWNKSLIHHVVWNIRLYRSFPPRCFWCLLHIEHGGLRIYLQPNQRTAVRRQTQMVLERFIMFVWSLMNCFTTTRWKFSLLDLTSVSKTESVSRRRFSKWKSNNVYKIQKNWV